MTIQEIKSRLSIGQVLDHYGIKVNKNKMVNCPFHDDKNPSMQVYPETNTVHCFSGNCEHTGKAIDQIDFILHKEGCTKHQAIVKAKSMLSASEIPQGGKAILKAKKLLGESIITQVNKKHGTMSNLNETFKQLQQDLQGAKKAKEYLESRSLFDIKLEIGFKPAGSGSKIITGMTFYK